MHPFQCPLCAGVFQIMPNFAGQAVACPHCNGAVLIPEMSPPAGSPPFSAAEPPPIIGRTTEFALASAQPPLPLPQLIPPPDVVPTPSTPTIVPPNPAAPNASMLFPPDPGGDPSQIPAPVAHDPTPQRQFVIPTIDGGQAVIREPAKVAVSGTKRRQLRDLTSEQKSTRRWIKNVVVCGLCAALLMLLMWWLLK